MKADLFFLGGAREVGRSAVLLEIGKRILLDYGIKIHPETTQYPLPLHGFVDYAIVSHAHLDHCGYLPHLYEMAQPRAIMSFPTRAIAELLIEDSRNIQIMKGEEVFSKVSIKKAWKYSVLIPYDVHYRIDKNTKLAFRDAGHIPGSSIVEIIANEKKIVYTGDFKLSETRLHKPAKTVRDVTLLIIESTYCNREHPDRKELEKQIKEEVADTIENGGCALFPSFAVGRAQELVQILAETDYPIFLDGMAKAASEIIVEYPSYVKDHASLLNALNKAVWVKNDRQRMKISKSPSVVITTAGMLEGGPVLRYLPMLNKNSKIFLTGFQVEKTNGWQLLNTGKVVIDGIIYEPKLPVLYYDLSAHAGREDLLRFVKEANAEKIFCIHGDHCPEFAEELRGMGYDAYAPTLGEKIEVSLD